MPIINFQGNVPAIDDSSWLSETAIITGKVTIGKNCSIWYHTVIRGDVNSIIIGNRVNIQDLSMVHGSYGGQDTVIGNGCSIGHRAIIHGCTLQDSVLVGMGAVVLDDCLLESHCVIAAGAVVTKGTLCKSGWIYAGIPAKPIKKMDNKQISTLVEGTAAGYVKIKELYRES